MHIVLSLHPIQKHTLACVQSQLVFRTAVHSCLVRNKAPTSTFKHHVWIHIIIEVNGVGACQHHCYHVRGMGLSLLTTGAVSCNADSTVSMAAAACSFASSCMKLRRRFTNCFSLPEALRYASVPAYAFSSA